MKSDKNIFIWKIFTSTLHTIATVQSMQIPVSELWWKNQAPVQTQTNCA